MEGKAIGKEEKGREEGMDIKETDGQKDSITIASIYNSIRKLSKEDQILILANYKIGDLFKMYNNKEEFNKYRKYLIDTAELYTQTARALDKHREEAVEEGGDKWESDMVNAMEEAYGSMTEWGQEKFCQEMAGDSGFFQKAYRAVIGMLVKGWKGYKNEPAE